MLNSWLYTNAYNLIKSGKTCSYAIIKGHDYVKKLNLIENIKIEIVEMQEPPKLIINNSANSEIIYSQNIQKSMFDFVSGDTLYLKIRKNTYLYSDIIYINLPLLQSVTVFRKTHSFEIQKNIIIPNGSAIPISESYCEYSFNTTISGFKNDNISVFYSGNCNFEFKNNKLRKLSMKNDLKSSGIVDLLQYTDCDSLDFDLKSQFGTLKLGSDRYSTQENPKQWINIKVSKYIKVQGDAWITSKIKMENSSEHVSSFRKSKK